MKVAEAKSIADAQRIASCLNAMVGIESPVSYVTGTIVLRGTLESLTKVNIALANECNVLQQKRGQTVVALSEAIRYAEKSFSSETPNIQKWRSALLGRSTEES